MSEKQSKQSVVILEDGPDTEIVVKLSRSQHELLMRVAKVHGLEDWELVLHYIRYGMAGDMDEPLRNLLLDIPDSELNDLIAGISDD